MTISKSDLDACFRAGNQTLKKMADGNSYFQATWCRLGGWNQGYLYGITKRTHAGVYVKKYDSDSPSFFMSVGGFKKYFKLA